MLSGGGALASNGSVDLTASTTNATFNISGITGTTSAIGSLSGATNAKVDLGAKNLTVGGSNSGTFAGSIIGSGGSLTKSGSGTLILSGAATYTGGTTNQGGNLVLSGDGALASGGSVNLTASTTNATFDIANIAASGTTIGSLAGSDGKAPDLRGFALAGADHKWHWARAEIQDSSVIVSSAEVPHPEALRYAWADNPEAGLYNREGLPAVPFRADDWSLEQPEVSAGEPAE